MSFAQGPFAIEAVLSNRDPGVGADLELIDLLWCGVSVCPSGTHQLDAE